MGLLCKPVLLPPKGASINPNQGEAGRLEEGPSAGTCIKTAGGNPSWVQSSSLQDAEGKGIG